MTYPKNYSIELGRQIRKTISEVNKLEREVREILFKITR